MLVLRSVGRGFRAKGYERRGETWAMAQEVVVGVVAITETDMVALAQEGYSGEASMILKLVLRGGEMYSLHEHQRCTAAHRMYRRPLQLKLLADDCNVFLL